MSGFYVADKYRINSLSFEQGGYDVAVTFSNGSTRIYDKVKFPDLFIAKLKKSYNVLYCKVYY
jgi:hypothetical protein